MSSRIIIEIPQSALFRVFESGSIQQGMTHDAPGGARLELGPMPMEKRGGLTQDALPMATVLLSLGRDVAVALFATWLYDKLKSDKAGKAMHVTKIKINETKVEIDPDAITRVITRSIEIEQR